MTRIIRNDDSLDSNNPTVVSSHKGIAICAMQLSVDIFLGLLECDVHVSIYGLKLSCSKWSILFTSLD
jgi:hypothetical protein